MFRTRKATCVQWLLLGMAEEEVGRGEGIEARRKK